MITRIVVALIAGAALAIPAGLILPWMIGALPQDWGQKAFILFDRQQNLAVSLWLGSALMFLMAPTDQRWRWLLIGLALLFWAIPLWSIVFLGHILASEVSNGGGRTVALAIAGGLLGSASIWTLRRSSTRAHFVRIGGAS